jgi:alkylhydroperoxidase family enzyme
MDIGSAVSRENGVTEDKLRELSNYTESSLFSEQEKLVLRYADAMTNIPVEVSDALFTALHEQFDTAQMVELTSAIAWENYRARFDHAFGIESENFSEGAVCVLPASDRLSRLD